MNIFKTMTVRDLEQATRDIPVIDLAPAFAGTPGATARVAAALRHASEHVGFFYIAGHGVPQATIDAAFAASREFHAMPLEDKLALKINENNIGYLPVNASIQGASRVHTATRPNDNESFFISHDRRAEHPDVVAGPAASGAQPVASRARSDARGDGAVLHDDGDARGADAPAARAGPRSGRGVNPRPPRLPKHARPPRNHPGFRRGGARYSDRQLPAEHGGERA